MGAKSSSGASNLTLLAAGATTIALATTSSISVADHENGAYWYNYPGSSVGFAESSQVDLRSADISNQISPSCSRRLSWDLWSGGWRAGCAIGLYSSTWRKLIYSSSGIVLTHQMKTTYA